MKEEEKQPLADQEISIDDETEAIFQAIEDADDDVKGLVKIAELHPDIFNPDLLAAYAKATGKEDDPQIKALIQAVRERIGGPTP